MILRKIAEAIREQNWFTVVLEVLIVVFGVFIGLQVDGWNEDRKARVQERQTLERLFEESQAAVGFFRDRVALEDRLNTRREAVVAAVFNGDVDAIQSDGALFGIVSLTFYPAISPPQSVFNDVSTSGSFSEISDIGVKTAISEYYAWLEFLSGQMDFWREGVSTFEKSWNGNVYSIYDPEAPDKRRLGANAEALIADPAFKDRLAHALRQQLVFRNYYNAGFERAITMCKELARAVGEECEVAKNDN